MINYNEIGARIKEQRKYIMKVSQEKMAEDLMMYQADISNLEKAKSGSGITDLSKLELIADYFGIPLETLLFGREENNMMKYYGDTMKIVQSTRKITKTHKKTLLKLTGQPEGTDINPAVYECGPYVLYSIFETQYALNDRDEDSRIPVNTLRKMHTFIFLGNELIALMVADLTTVMQHVFQPALVALQKMIQFDVLDVIDCWRTLNPYWAMWRFSPEEEEDQYYDKMFERMQALRDAGEDRPVLYIENAYVREDCRRNGIFRMYVDYLKLMYDGCIIWLNMEPTNGTEMEQEYEQVPSYTISDLGQLSLNAAIAEKVGFTIDPDTWHRQVEKIDDNGNHYVETALVRKCAYYLPPAIRILLADDGDLVARGRALQKLERKEDEEKDVTVDLHNGLVDGCPAAELKITIHGERAYFCTAIMKEDGSGRFVVSHNSLIRDDKEWIIEEYSSLEDAVESEYYDDLMMAAGFVGMGVESDMDEEPELPAGSFCPVRTFVEPENFDVSDIISATIGINESTPVTTITQATIKRTNTESAGEVLYAMILSMPEDEQFYGIARKSLEMVAIKADMKFVEDLDFIEFVDEEEVKTSKYLPIYMSIMQNTE